MLSNREYNALLKICQRTTLARTLCLIEEHHHVPSILAPFSFVMKCITNGGYKVPSTKSPRQKVKPLPKAIRAQLEAKHQEPEMLPDELAKAKARIEQRLKRSYL